MNPELPAITVAIPTYNGGRHVEEALRSVLRQEGTAFDLLISDDGSTDATLDLVRSVAGDRARIAVNSERLGLAGNWNRCVALSRTPFVAIFHQDDRMGSGHLAAHLAAFAPGVGIVASASDVIDDSGRPVSSQVVDPGGCGPLDRTFPPGAFLTQLARGNPLRCSAVTLRAEAHRGRNGFDSRYRYVVDWDLWIKLARDWSVAWIGRPTVSVRWHSASETHAFKTGVADLDESIALFESLVRDHPELASFRQIANRRLARAFLNRAYDASNAGQSALARLSLRRAFSLRPGIIATLLGHPRLAARLLLGSFGASRPRP